jgi:hypothetical protein
MGYVEILCGSQPTESNVRLDFGTRYLWKLVRNEWQMVAPFDKYHNPCQAERDAFLRFLDNAQSLNCSPETEESAAKLSRVVLEGLLIGSPTPVHTHLSPHRYYINVLDSWDADKYEQSVARAIEKYTMANALAIVSLENPSCSPAMTSIVWPWPVLKLRQNSPRQDHATIPGLTVVATVSLKGGNERRILLQWVLDDGRLMLWNVS